MPKRFAYRGARAAVDGVTQHVRQLDGVLGCQHPLGRRGELGQHGAVPVDDALDKERPAPFTL
jgi:hypothetical protein